MKKLILILSIILLAANAFAGDEKKTNIIEKIVQTAVSPIDTVLGTITDLERIVITPSRVEEKLGANSSSISVIDYKDFDRAKTYDVKDALRQQVGLDIVQSGAFQGQTALFTRGGNSNHTLIMIDGVKAYDPISPNAAYNLAHLTLDNVERIEVLRGPQSALYGSDAMAGVVSIISKRAEEPYVDMSYESGSFYTNKEHFEAGAKTEMFHYSISASRYDTRGISQAEAKNNNPERDPYNRSAVAGRIDYDLGEALTVGATLRHTDSRYKYDDLGRDVDNLRSIDKETFLTTYAQNKLFDWWRHSIKLGWMKVNRWSFDDAPPANHYYRSKYMGKYFKLDYMNDFDIVDKDHFIIGYDYTEEMGDNFYENRLYATVSDMPKVFSREGGLTLENRFNLSDRLTATQGVRIGHHSSTGTFETYRLDGSYLLVTGTKIRGLWATGFKAPTLYQLFSPADPLWSIGGGNPNLKPERSRSYEYGVDQYIFGEKVIVSVTYFNTIFRDLIDAVYHPDTFVTDQYANIGKATVHGIEASIRTRPVKNIMAEFGFTYQKTKNKQNDRDLLRRPEKKFYAELFWVFLDKFTFDVKLRYNGPMSDSGGYKIKEYTVVDFITNYDLTKNLSVYVKLNNVFDQHYEEVLGYSTAPFAAYGGVKAKF